MDFANVYIIEVLPFNFYYVDLPRDARRTTGRTARRVEENMLLFFVGRSACFIFVPRVPIKKKKERKGGENRFFKKHFFEAGDDKKIDRW
jgi:hypothetical protein